MFWAQKKTCFRLIYNWNFNWRLHPLNERAIGATMLQIIDRDINFHILQKKIRSQVYSWLGLTVPKSIFWDMAAMTVEQWQQLHQLVAKTVDTAGNHRYWSNTVKSLCCGSIKDKSYQSASHSRLSWCQSSLQGWSTVRKHFSSLVLYLEAASRTRSEISRSREQDDCYTVPHILNIPNVTLACDEAPAGIRMVIRRVRQEE